MSFLQQTADYRFSSAFSVKPERRAVLDPNILSPGEDLDGNVTLVVVDMQPGFQDAIDQATLDAVERQILLAIRRKWAIVLLEMDPWRNGPTYPQLMRHLKDGPDKWIYGRAFMRVKSSDSGAGQVVEACDDFRYPTKYFRACGVYLDACVQKTVLGIVRQIPDASVRCIREAMNTNFDHAGAWACFPSLPHVVVSSEKIRGGSHERFQ